LFPVRHDGVERFVERRLSLCQSTHPVERRLLESTNLLLVKTPFERFVLQPGRLRPLRRKAFKGTCYS
jgi:hypothetical protein